MVADFKDAINEGNGQRVNQLHKQSLRLFKTDSSFNTYAIEMLVNVVQNEVLLSKSEAYKCTWAATVNLGKGQGKNVEIDLLQENMNRDPKKPLKNMGANKTDRAIERASKAVGRGRKIIENFDMQMSITPKSTQQCQQSSLTDEIKILKDFKK